MTDELRYPIGPSPRPEITTAEERRAWIGQIAALPEEVRAVAQGAAEKDLETPYREGGWTLRQVVHHLADSHMNAFIRMKLALTEDQPVIKPYDEARWAELADTACEIDVSLRLLGALHLRWVAQLLALQDADWNRTFLHPENGVTRLDQQLALYAWHGRHHLAHIKAAREAAGVRT